MEGIRLHTWMLWLLVLIIFLILELMTQGLTTIWFALGAFVAMLVAIWFPGLVVELCTFVGVSLIALLLTRPLTRRLVGKKPIPTNVDRLLGATYRIVEQIDEQDGLIEVGDVRWRVRSSEEATALTIGTAVVIERIEGNLLWVRRKLDA